ncbi:uncharacterized protein LOC135842837 [Planococcus citri]|uniref:uncharacterized protein LOC135842837 n=1 Tax=Planococcus citri TaxID=170843 RepID=UPI0031F73DC9
MFRCVVPKIQRAVLNSRVRFQSNNSADRKFLLSQVDLLTKQLEAKVDPELIKAGVILAKVKEILTETDAEKAKAESDFVYNQLFGNDDEIDDDERAAVKKTLQELDKKYDNSSTSQSSNTSTDTKSILKKVASLTRELEVARANEERAKADAKLAQADAEVAKAEAETVYNQLFGNNPKFDDDQRAAIKKKLQELEENYIRNRNPKA